MNKEEIKNLIDPAYSNYYDDDIESLVIYLEDIILTYDYDMNIIKNRIVESKDITALTQEILEDGGTWQDIAVFLEDIVYYSNIYSHFAYSDKGTLQLINKNILDTIVQDLEQLLEKEIEYIEI